MKRHELDLLVGGLRFWLLAIAAGMFMIIGYALWSGLYLGEPNAVIARIEAAIMLALAGLSIAFAGLEVKRKD